jgi:hypothetical protein
MKELKYSPYKKRLVYGLEMERFYKRKTGKDIKTENPATADGASPTPGKVTRTFTFRAHRKSLFKEDLKLPQDGGGEDYARYDQDFLTTAFIEFDEFVDILLPLSQYAKVEDKIKCIYHFPNLKLSYI